MQDISVCKKCLCYSCKKLKLQTGCGECGSLKCIGGGVKRCAGYVKEVTA